MTTLAAKHQPRLSLPVCVRLVATGIGFRMMRSGVTVAVQALAVAFMVYVFAAGTIDTAVQHGAAEQHAPYRAADTQLSRLRQPDSADTIIRAFAQQEKNPLAEYAAWAGLNNAQRQDLTTAAQHWTDAQRWAQTLRDDDRALLLGDETLAQAADQLASQAAQDRFRQRLADRQLQPPRGADALLTTLTTQRAALRNAANTIRQGHAAALSSLPPLPLNPDDPIGPDLTAPDAQQLLARAGFVIDPETLTDLQPFARRRAVAEMLIAALQQPDVRRAVARRAKIGLNEVSTDRIPPLLRDESDAAWLADVLPKDENKSEISPATLLDYARHARREARLAAVLPSEDAPAEQAATQWLGLAPRTLLLVALSCLVCVAGITNAMMMSVTERFTEIATMKCLGARSESILVLFLIESAVLGIAGGVLGVLLGMLLAAGSGAWRYGTMLTHAGAALRDLSLVALAALVLGIVLSMFAALLPSMFAARLPPMAAMRVE